MLYIQTRIQGVVYSLTCQDSMPVKSFIIHKKLVISHQRENMTYFSGRFFLQIFHNYLNYILLFFSFGEYDCPITFENYLLLT